jgi:hypothetical protein
MDNKRLCFIVHNVALILIWIKNRSLVNDDFEFIYLKGGKV